MIEPTLNLVYSRVGNEIAIPILDWNHMQPSNQYAIRYFLEKFAIFDVIGDIKDVIHTRKIPLAIKNKHRKFWKMPLLKS